MRSKLIPKTVIGSLYLLFSIVLIVIILAVYIGNVHDALTMDPNSYNCTSDSMMKNICEHPYSSSILWTAVTVGVTGGPLLIAWVVIGLYLVTREPKKVTE